MATTVASGEARTGAQRVALPPITTGTRISYGIGAVATGLKGAVFNTFLIFYYNQVVGIPRAWCPSRSH